MLCGVMSLVLLKVLDDITYDNETPNAAGSAGTQLHPHIDRLTPAPVRYRLERLFEFFDRVVTSILPQKSTRPPRAKRDTGGGDPLLKTARLGLLVSRHLLHSRRPETPVGLVNGAELALIDRLRSTNKHKHGNVDITSHSPAHSN
jgi:hypothetical protein